MSAICPNLKGFRRLNVNDRGGLRISLGPLPHPSTSSTPKQPQPQRHQNAFLESEPCPESAERVLPKNANSGAKIIRS